VSGDDLGPRTLVVIRHAHAEGSAASDQERRLTDTGLAGAADIGTWLVTRGVQPDHALVSAAVRTEQTWRALAEAAGWDLEPELDEGLYVAGPETALDLLRIVPDDVRTLLVVGHNPTMASLAQLLDDGEGDVRAGNELARGYPPAATAVLTYRGVWSGLGPATASLAAFHVGRG
jgi:phosphohistidine phosphatase